MPTTEEPGQASKNAAYPPTRSLHVTFGQAVRRHRKSHGLSQERLAERAHCDRQSINRLENAAYSPSLVRIGEVAAALGVPPSVLFAEAEQIMSEHRNPERSPQ